MLRENLLTGVYDKVAVAIERLTTFESCAGEDGYYVAFSGGKDSIVVKRLVEMSGVRHDGWHFNVTSVDPPELLNYIRNNHKDVTWHTPEKTMWKLIEENMMPPTRIVRYCCENLKERSGDGRVIVTGVRWAESVRRSQRGMFEVCRRDKTKHYLHPIIDWSDADVWEFISQEDLPYCSLYDEGWNRIGCVGCPMSSTRLRDFARWPQFERAYRKAFSAAARSRVAGKKEWISEHPLYTHWIDEQAMWDWWMNENRSTGDIEGQCLLFE